jgi:hypothetical protein
MEETPKRKGRPELKQVFWRNCGTCNFMRLHPDFRLRMMQSTYFNPSGTESLLKVLHDFGDVLKPPSVYMHIRRHQQKDLIRAREQFLHRANDGKNVFIRQDARVPGTPDEAIEGEVVATGQHEAGLDEFIAEGRRKLLGGKMTITATNYLAAIKIRTEIDKSTKDRRLDMIKSFFGGGEKKDAPKNDG